MNDLWEYNFDLGLFRFHTGNVSEDMSDIVPPHYMKDKTAYIGDRYSSAMFCHISTQPESMGDREIIIFGGNGFDAPIISSHGRMNDLWSYNIDRDYWTWINGSTTRNSPGIFGQKGLFGKSYPAAKHFPVYVTLGDMYGIFGGGFPSSPWYTNNVFIFNPHTRLFAHISGRGDSGSFNSYIFNDEEKVYHPSNRIGARYWASGWSISPTEFFIFGGHGYAFVGGTETHGDLWIMNTTLAQWKFMSGVKSEDEFIKYEGVGMKIDSPIRRKNTHSFFHDGYIYVVGGESLVQNVNMNDITRYDLINDEWILIYGSSSYNQLAKYSDEYSSNNILGTIMGAAFTFHILNENDIEIFLITGHGSTNNDLIQMHNGISSLKRMPNCFGRLIIHENVCNGHGSCIQDDTCICMSNYYGYDCSISFCNNVLSNVSNVCSSRGFCIDEKCKCLPNFEGNNCEMALCIGLRADENEVCSGNGVCGKDAKCHCEFGWEGDVCGTRNVAFYILLDVWYLPVSIVVIILVVCAFSILIGCVCCCIISKQQKTLKKVEEIGDIDILLEEKRLDEDTSIAHLRVNKNLFEVNEKDIRLIKRLGKGGSDTEVFLVSWKGEKVAFKQFRNRSNYTKTQDDFENFEKEVQIIASVSHPNIIRFFGAILSDHRLGFLMEYAEEGEIDAHLRRFKEKNGFSVSITEKLRMLREVASAINHLHSLKIIHRDLKPQNVLIVGKDKTAKVVDFGISKVIESGKELKTTIVGTSFYRAPEISSGRYDFKADVFSFGILIFAVISERFSDPYNKNSKRGNVQFSMSKVSSDPSYRPSIGKEFQQVPRWIKVLMEQCWTHRGVERPSFEKILMEMKGWGNDVIDSDKNDGSWKKENSRLKKENKDLKRTLKLLEKKLLSKK